MSIYSMIPDESVEAGGRRLKTFIDYDSDEDARCDALARPAAPGGEA